MTRQQMKHLETSSGSKGGRAPAHPQAPWGSRCLRDLWTQAQCVFLSCWWSSWHLRPLCPMLISSAWKPFSYFHNLWREWSSFWFSSYSTECHLKECIGKWNCLCLVMTVKLLFENFKQTHISQSFIVLKETYHFYLKYIIGCEILLNYRLVSTKRRPHEWILLAFLLSVGGIGRIH